MAFRLAWNDASQATLASCLVISAETTRLISASQTELAAAVARTPLLVRQIRTNKAPALTPMYDLDDSEVELDLGIEQIEEIGGAVRENAAFRMRLRLRVANLFAICIGPASVGRYSRSASACRR